MQESEFTVEVVSGVPVVTAPEEIDITNAPMLRSALLEAAAQGHGTLVADLSRTRFCDSSGLHTLLAAHKRAQAGDGELLLVLRGTTVPRVFALTGIDQMIPTFTSLAGPSRKRLPTDGQPSASWRGGGRTAPRRAPTWRDNSALADLTDKPADREACASWGPLDS